MAAIIIDIQGLTVSNFFVVKELSSVTIEDNIDNLEDSTCLLFKPLCKLDGLSGFERKQNKWLTDLYYGLDWSSGTIPYENMKNILDIILKDRSYVYVKGSAIKQ